MWTLVPVRAFGGDLELCAGLTWYGMDVKALDSSPGGRKPRQEFAHRVACVYYEPVVLQYCDRPRMGVPFQEILASGAYREGTTASLSVRLSSAG
jgi:hypothetical protein